MKQISLEQLSKMRITGNTSIRLVNKYHGPLPQTVVITNKEGK